jgi:phenylalanyl-tRNA synthetase beta chain
MYVREGDGREALFELKHLAECLMEGCRLRPATARAFEHPERAAIVAWRGEDIGRLFELHPSLVSKGRASILDLDLTKMEKLDDRERRYQPLRRFPTSSFNITVDAPLRALAGDIEHKLAGAAGSDLVEIKFLGEYVADPRKGERKSVSYRLTVGAWDRTLTSEEAAAIREKVMAAVLTRPD